MLRTLYAKLALALFVLFALVGAGFFVASLYSAYLYQQEVAQRLNRDLAMYIVDEQVRVRDGRIDTSTLKDLFHTVMIINPSLELYLLDSDGRVIAYSTEFGEIPRRRVSLEPIEQLLAGEVSMPVLGDNPRSATGRKVFSAFPIEDGGRRLGYIYAVLGSEQVDHISEMLQQSTIMRMGVGAVMLALVFAFLGGLVLFFAITRRLHRLSRSMQQFQRSSIDEADAEPVAATAAARDEIDSMQITFEQMARRIESQMSRLKETDALRRELVANVSHDLRTPLASLKGYVETLLLKDDRLSEGERRQYLQIAHDNAQRLNKLVNELFELAKLDAGELKLRRETFSLAELAHDVIQKFQLRAREQNVALEVDIDSDVPFVEADIGLIERVLDNLVDNALKNTPAGGTIRLTLDSDGKLVSIQVADTGRGIASHELPHIFRRFYRRSDPGQPSSGAGLGLAIAQRIVELHGSELSVRSILHQGTRFAFALPVQAGS